MLEENRNSKFKSFILIVILIVLMLFVLVWLFPTKGFVNQRISESLNDTLDASATQLFNENVQIMGDAAKDYFTGSRLPENGNTETIALGEMLEKHLLIEFVDSKGSTCDKEQSYVEVTNENDEHTMKINLSCTDIKDYVIIYMSNSNVLSSNEVAKNDSCEYKKVTNAKWSDYSAWSSWQTKKITKTDYNKVETKTEKVNTGVTSVAHKKIEEAASTKNETKQYICDNSYDNAGTYSKETGCVKTSEPKEEMRAKKVYICDSTYDNEGIYTKYTKCMKNSNAKLNITVTYTCPSEYDNAGVYEKETTCKKTIITYNKENQYKNVTYYRQQTRTLLSGDSDVKWSNCNDISLINSGYYKTGNVK